MTTTTDPEDLRRFVRDALAQGHDPDRLRGALTATGWPDAAIDRALGGWALHPGLPPVPRPSVPAETPRLAGRRRRVTLAQVMLLLTLAFLCWHVVWLGFGVIDAWRPAGLRWIDRDSLRWSSAAVAVSLALVWALRIRLRGQGRLHRTGRLVAGGAVLICVATLLGAAVWTLYRLLAGDLTAAFAAKTALVVLLAGLVAGLYRDDLA